MFNIVFGALFRIWSLFRSDGIVHFFLDAHIFKIRYYNITHRCYVALGIVSLLLGIDRWHNNERWLYLFFTTSSHINFKGRYTFWDHFIVTQYDGWPAASLYWCIEAFYASVHFYCKTLYIWYGIFSESKVINLAFS
jgi:hypothetical protein